MRLPAGGGRCTGSDPRRGRASPTATSRQINDRVAASIHGGSRSTDWTLRALAEADPDLILTQELCDVCAVSYREVAEAVRLAGDDSEVVSLEPTSIEGILNTISTVGAYGRGRGRGGRTDRAAARALGAYREPRPGAPPGRHAAAKGRLPRMARPALRGRPLGSRAGSPSGRLGPAGQCRATGRRDDLGERRATSSPRVLVLMPCGFDAPRTADEWRRRLRRSPEWLDEIWPRVRDGEIYALDGSAYFSRPGPRVIDGIALLAEIFDPGDVHRRGADRAFSRVAEFA